MAKKSPRKSAGKKTTKKAASKSAPKKASATKGSSKKTTKPAAKEQAVKKSPSKKSAPKKAAITGLRGHRPFCTECEWTGPRCLSRIDDALREGVRLHGDPMDHAINTESC